MTADLIVRGDHLAVLSPLTVIQAPGSESPRALVWGLDLRHEATRHAAQKRLKQVSREVAGFAATYPRLTHVLVAYTHGGSLPEGTCLATAAQTSTRMHATLERTRGQSIDVVTLDVTGWEDGELLRDRILEAVTGNASAAGDVALGWHDIVDIPIHAAAMRQFY
ncbi:hypothetical protein ASD56_07310 [Microbacterium sp. Root166]|uniref:hypothetical protein n=1 Tax=Microbacterium sp. Root166 TaxID=1736478 RepID=UPI0006F88BDF|nr:hypothetical protein [Microbacterium sp. Root166]KQZ86063.1 hypothetical protein ASD56_07310 [Microbacterium sp. Root166]